MSGYADAYTNALSSPMGTRSLSAICAAVAAVGIISGALVTLELVGAPAARATTASPAMTAPIAATTNSAASARRWDLEPRWWLGDGRQVTPPAPALRPAPAVQPAAGVRESDLTFSKGYQQRLAARAAALAAQLTVPPTGTSAVATRKLDPIARVEPAQEPRPTAAHSDASVDQASWSDFGSQALAFGEPSATQRGVAFGSIFGNLH